MAVSVAEIVTEVIEAAVEAMAEAEEVNHKKKILQLNIIYKKIIYNNKIKLLKS